MSELPAGWTAITLGEVIDGFESGRNLRARGSPAEPGEYGVIKISAVTWGEFRPEENKALLAGDTPKDREVIRKGDVLISRANTTELVGAVVEVPSDYPHLMLPDKVLRIRALASVVHAPFLVRALRIRAARDHFAENASGTSDSMRNLSQPKLEATPLLLPPLNEQKRIVAKIDALTEKSRAAREALAEVPELLDKLRQSILAAAFRGDLTKKWREQNPDVEPATMLLERIRAERRKKWEEAELAKFKAKGKVPKDDKWKAKYVEPEPVDTDGLPELPEGWCWASVEELGGLEENAITDGPFGSNLKSADYVDDGFAQVVTLGNLGDGFFKNEKQFFVTQAKWESLIKHHITTGDLVVAALAEPIARACRVPAIGPALVKADCIKVSPHSDIDRDFLVNAFNSPQVRHRAEEVGHGVGRLRINLGEMKALPIPIAPKREQREVVRSLDLRPNLDTVYDYLTEQLNRLDSSILAKAFRGELVPQDPNDEPASVLLERVRKERDAAAAKTKRPKRGAQTRV